MSEHQPSPGDFNREDQPATSDGVVEFLTTYSRMMASPEEHHRVMLRAYGPDRLPGTESRRRSQMGLSPLEPDPHGACEHCGEPLTWGVRFCSQDCFHEWVAEQKPEPPTPEELRAEMLARLDELRAFIEERE